MVGTILGALFTVFVICVLTLIGGGVLIGCLIKAIRGLFSKPKA